MTARRAFLASFSVSALAAFAGVAIAADPLSKWQAGTHYHPLRNPVPPSVASGKVEVLEVFWYGCGHCFALDPVLEDWNKKKAPFIEFVRVPVIWGPQHRQHAKLYYTLQALRRPDLHARVFNTIHREGALLADHDEATARAIHLAFFVRHGITEEQFNAAYDSMTVAMNMQRAETLTKSLGVDSVPVMFVNGKYAALVTPAGGEAQLISVIDSLAASEKR